MILAFFQKPEMRWVGGFVFVFPWRCSFPSSFSYPLSRKSEGSLMVLVKAVCICFQEYSFSLFSSNSPCLSDYNRSGFDSDCRRSTPSFQRLRSLPSLFLPPFFFLRDNLSFAGMDDFFLPPSSCQALFNLWRRPGTRFFHLFDPLLKFALAPPPFHLPKCLNASGHLRFFRSA